MHNRMRFGYVLGVLLVLALTSTAAGQGAAASLGTGFTYQGRLEDGGAPANGAYDFRFILYDAEVGGSPVGGTLERGDVTVTGGYFSVALDFGAVFGDQALWLEVSVRPGASTGSYTVLQPRQALTGTPFALYARRAPWGGLNGVPAGFADGVDNDTTYSAGTGLTMSGTTLSADAAYLQRRVTGACGVGSSIRQINADGTVTCEPDDGNSYSAGTGLSLSSGVFSVNFTGPGTAATAARSDHTHTTQAHNHLGQTWTGNASPALELISTNGTALRVSAGVAGVSVSDAYTGLWIGNATSTGVLVDSASNGIHVRNAKSDGIKVDKVGSPSTYVVSSYKNGVEIGGAEGNGLEVGRADVVGVYVQSAGYDGVVVGKAGSPSASGSASSSNNGVEVRSAQGNGLEVVRADMNGVYVRSAVSDGIEASGTQYAGYFHSRIFVNGTIYGAAQGSFAVNTGSRALEPGEFVAVRGVRQDAGMGAPLVLEVVPAEEGGSVIGVVQARAERVLEERPAAVEGEQATQEPKLVPGEGAAEPGAYLAVITYGVTQARVGPESAALQAGDRLAVSAAGLVRGLRTVEVNGVPVAESASVVGIALDAPGADGLVWVLVNPQ